MTAPPVGEGFQPPGVVSVIMNGKKSRLAASSQLIDDIMECYVTWREQSAAVDAAYESWKRAPSSLEALAFDAYVSALDREEQAASQYRRVVEEVGACER
jgi:hypothetical protein